MTVDLVRRELDQPIDWEKFEQLVVELLAQDDLPRLRKIGGRGDFGQDAVDEAFFGPESRTESIVQITSQKAQVEKFVDTVKRLREARLTIKQLIMCHRQPVESGVRTEIQEKALGLAVAVDIRDGEYLVRQLGNPKNGIFARYFGTIGQQVDAMLDRADPLAIAPSRAYRAMLASLGAYVAHPKARLARRTLFDKAALATLVAQQGDRSVTIEKLLDGLRNFFPEEPIDDARVRATVSDLKGEGLCVVQGDTVRASKEALETVGVVLTRAGAAFKGLHDHVLKRVEEKGKLDDAARGYLERNLQHAMVHLFRSHGPLQIDGTGRLAETYDHSSIVPCLSESIGPEHGRRASLALHEYTIDPTNAESLAPLVRSYSALAIRNIDPLGRRWQQVALGRSHVALDTDAVLTALIDEVPECAPFRAALAALVAEKVRIIIPEAVFVETMDHIARAPRTMRKFQSRLHRLSPDAVDEMVWNNVVRGYYYSAPAGNRGPWEGYLAKYQDVGQPRKYLEFLLRKRLTFEFSELEVDAADFVDIESIVRDLVGMEDSRLKAQFRNQSEREERLMKDVRLAVALARLHPRGQWSAGSGYLVSEDGAFRKFERNAAWRSRPKVHVFRRAIPQLVGMICGKGIADTVLVRLLFDPVAGAAAVLMAAEIDLLSNAGVDLSQKSVDRLEWELRDQLQEIIHASPHASTGDPEEDRILEVIRVAEMAQAKGYSLDDGVKKVVDHHEELLRVLAEERVLRQVAEDQRDASESAASEQLGRLAKARDAIQSEAREQLAKVAKAAIGQTKRGRSRVRRALEHLGLNLDELLAGAEFGNPGDE